MPWTEFDGPKGFDLVLPLVTWGYHLRHAEWLAFLDRAEAERWPMVNPPELLRWNSDKAYLAELGRKGLASVPTLEVDHPVVWVDPGESGDRVHARPASLASEVLALSSGPRFEPGPSGIYTAGFAGYVTGRGRAAWHTHPAE